MQVILLIEDSKFLRLANGKALTRAGYDVLNAGDGLEGLKLAKEKSPHLILLDMMLPKVSGLDVLRALKQDPTTKAIPVVILTALSAKNKDKLANEGAAGFVEKSDELLANDSAALVSSVKLLLNGSNPVVSFADN
ncbi:MAG TPA: response regulator [Terriglobales bacterium]|nr:response regulator [Terriglobales bacterium]